MMDIAASTRRILDNFEQIRGKSVKENFWDLIVLAASDKDQADAFEKQIDLKKKLKHLPLGVEYIVYHDPPGPKIGCGGATMYVIQKLHSRFAEALWDKKILLLNAGGQSQRLPSASVLGKLFTALPIGDPMYQLFDFKLACYLPLLEKMKPGVFHAASDTIEVYDLGSDKSQWSCDRPGFTALAHPSTLEIGRTHGVYVLEENDAPVATSMRSCLEVLQKPSVEKMRKRGAVLNDTKDGGEFVYTDSCFYFDHNVSQKLLQFYDKHPVECEIDSYGDFLQCLGSRATVDYTQDVKNVKAIETNLVETRVKIFNMLKGTPLNILALEASKFYHFGTMREYIENLCNDPVIAAELGYKRVIFSDMPKELSAANGEDMTQPVEKRMKLSKSRKECIMSSVLSSPGSYVCPSSVVEYCDFHKTVCIGTNCIVSNCQLLENVSMKETRFSIVSGVFMHTVWIDQVEGGFPGAVTLVLSISDNVKKSVSIKEAEELKWLGKPFVEVIKCLLFELEEVFEVPNQCSLWTAKLFPVCNSMSESFEASYNLLQCVAEDRKLTQVPQQTRVSMQDILKRKSVSKMLEYRKELHETIVSRKQKQTIESNL